MPGFCFHRGIPSARPEPACRKTREILPRNVWDWFCFVPGLTPGMPQAAAARAAPARCSPTSKAEPSDLERETSPFSLGKQPRQPPARRQGGYRYAGTPSLRGAPRYGRGCEGRRGADCPPRAFYMVIRRPERGGRGGFSRLQPHAGSSPSLKYLLTGPLPLVSARSQRTAGTIS